MDRSRYPDDWPTISLRVREAAGWRCEWCGKPQGSTDTKSGKPVVLTVHHDGETADDKHDTSRLVALCQACHLAADLPRHVRNAAATRRRKRIEAGQLSMEATTG